MSETKDAALLGQAVVQQDDYSGPLGWSRLGLKIIIFDRPWLALLHLVLPFAIFCMLTTVDGDPESEGCTFFTCLLALIPLAELLGYATEQLAAHSSNTIAGLLNASLGNVPELVVTIICIAKHLDHIAIQTLVGGAISGLLVVSGLSMFFGGLKHQTQSFNKHNVLSLLYLILLVALFIVTITLAEYVEESRAAYKATAPRPRASHSAEVLAGSHMLALAALLVYFAFLLYSLHTHKDLFDDGNDEGEGGDEDEPLLGFASALVWMVVLVALISWLSDGMVDAIDGAATKMGIPSVVITMVLIPNVNNALEHLVAVIQAWKGHLDLSIAISVGSAAQLLVLLLPLAVITDWAISGSHSTLTLSMTPLLAALLLVSATFGLAILSTGHSSWLHGFLLLTCYVSVAVSACIMVDDLPEDPQPQPHSSTSASIAHSWHRIEQHGHTSVSLKRLIKATLSPAQ